MPIQLHTLPEGVSEACDQWAVAQVSVGSTATAIKAANAKRRSITVVNHGTTDVYLGPAGVTISTGVLLPGTAGAAVTLCTTAAVYGVVASGSQVVGYSEESD